MSYEIYITKHGFDVREWDSDVQQHVSVEKRRSMLHYLRCACHIEPGVTLRDIFNAVEPHQDLKNFLENWSWCNVAAFHAEAAKPTTPTTLIRIELHKHLESDEWDSGETVHMNGVGPLDADEPFEDGRKEGTIIDNWALELTPLTELADLPVVLCPRGDIVVWLNRNDPHYMQPGSDGKSQFFAYESCDIAVTFSLLDVLGEIYYEISFHGDPEDRDAARNMIMDRKREIEELTEEERAERMRPFSGLDKPETIN